MKTKRTAITQLGLYCTLMIGLWICPAITNAQVIYQQHFVNSGSGNTYVGTIAGWSAYMTTSNSAALNVTTGSTAVTNPIPMLSSVNGGYLAFNSNATANTTMSAFVTGLNLDLTTNGVITWNMNGSNTSDNIRLLVQVGGNWYASDLMPVSSGLSSNISSFTSTLNFSTMASNWRTFSITEGSSISLGSSAITQDLPSSIVTGIGYYFNGNGTVRIDDLSVSAVPEPGTWALFLLSISLGAALNRARRRVTLV